MGNMATFTAKASEINHAWVVVDAQGNDVPVVKKALCRCGGSTTKPFCDGTHSKIGFQGAIAAVQQTDETKSG